MRKLNIFKPVNNQFEALETKKMIIKDGLIKCATLINLSAETSDGVYASIPGCQASQLKSHEYKAVYDYEAQVSFIYLMSYSLGHIQILQYSTCSFLSNNQFADGFCLCLGGRRAFCVGWRCCGRRGSRWRWLVDSAKKWPHRIRSRLLPSQGMSLPDSHMQACKMTTFPCVLWRCLVCFYPLFLFV